MINNSNDCAKCDEGYHYENGECKLNKCFCEFGTAATGVNCPDHGSSKCSKSCSRYYHLDITGDTCLRNICECENGVARTGDQCHKNGTHICESCNKGFYFDEFYGRCYEKKCSCRNGVAFTGEECERHEFNSCKSCNDDNYELIKINDESFCRKIKIIAQFYNLDDRLFVGN